MQGSYQTDAIATATPGNALCPSGCAGANRTIAIGIRMNVLSLSYCYCSREVGEEGPSNLHGWHRLLTMVWRRVTRRNSLCICNLFGISVIGRSAVSYIHLGSVRRRDEARLDTPVAILPSGCTVSSDPHLSAGWLAWVVGLGSGHLD